MRKYVLLLLLISSLTQVHAQTYQQRIATAVQNNATYAKLIPDAKVTLCTFNSLLQCNATVPIYSDPALTVLIPYPFYADINGNYQYYALPGTYVEQVCAPLNQCYTYQVTLIQSGGGGGGGGCSPVALTYSSSSTITTPLSVDRRSLPTTP